METILAVVFVVVVVLLTLTTRKVRKKIEREESWPLPPVENIPPMPKVKSPKKFDDEWNVGGSNDPNIY